jgi:hypothetical protein
MTDHRTPSQAREYPGPRALPLRLVWKLMEQHADS